MDPLDGLRSVGRRMADPLELRAQGIAERVVDLVVNSLDLNALLQQVDINALLGRVDINAVVARVDVDQLLDTVDVDKLLSRVDVNKLLDRVDVEAVVDQVDVNAVMDRVDVNAIVERVNIDALAAQTDIGALIAQSSGGMAASALDVARSQAVGLDEFVARWTGRVRRRRYSGPPGPPTQLRAPDQADAVAAAVAPPLPGRPPVRAAGS